MLNISLNSVTKYVGRVDLPALRAATERQSGRVLIKLLALFTVLFVLCLLLPWTQYIRATGEVTTLLPDQRPQTVQSVIGGQIGRWYVREGDFVAAGDTILHLTETKDDYFDPELLDRTRQQVRSKELSVQSYTAKAAALEDRMQALRRTAQLKTEQARNKLRQSELRVVSDSIDYAAARLNTQTVEDQFRRLESLYEQGLKSLTELENRRVKYLEARAKLIGAENKLLASRNDLLNARVEISAIGAKLRDDLAKAESDRFSALSNRFEGEAQVTKLENQYSNYARRTDLYYVLAPQAGYVTETLQAGLGETIKPGDRVVSIVPADYQLAVSVYVRPLDLPLLELGQTVNIQFDGWPSIVFSGWPNVSYGTYLGEVFAIDRSIGANGKYRVLVREAPTEAPWPAALRVGAGANSLVLLNDVPVWYELWRQLNGFPPDLYAAGPSDAKKAPKK